MAIGSAKAITTTTTTNTNSHYMVVHPQYFLYALYIFFYFFFVFFWGIGHRALIHAYMPASLWVYCRLYLRLRLAKLAYTHFNFGAIRLWLLYCKSMNPWRAGASCACS